MTKTIFILLLTLPLAACGHRASVAVTPTAPEAAAARLVPNIISKAYTYEDENTVHIYLSDLSNSDLTNPEAVGQIVHIHMFIRPNPGRTPIEPDALNASIRHAILAPNGATGIYAGGGFLLPDSRAKSGSFEGAISKGTLRLEAATPNFTDALGPANLRASFDVPYDEQLAKAMSSRLAEAVRQTARRQ